MPFPTPPLATTLVRKGGGEGGIVGVDAGVGNAEVMAELPPSADDEQLGW